MDGNSLGANVIVKVNLPRMIEKGAAADTVQTAGESAGQSSKAVAGSSFLVNLAMSASLN